MASVVDCRGLTRTVCEEPIDGFGEIVCENGPASYAKNEHVCYFGERIRRGEAPVSHVEDEHIGSKASGDIEAQHGAVGKSGETIRRSEATVHHETFGSFGEAMRGSEAPVSSGQYEAVRRCRETIHGSKTPVSLHEAVGRFGEMVRDSEATVLLAQHEVVGRFGERIHGGEAPVSPVQRDPLGTLRQTDRDGKAPASPTYEKQMNYAPTLAFVRNWLAKDPPNPSFKRDGIPVLDLTEDAPLAKRAKSSVTSELNVKNMVDTTQSILTWLKDSTAPVAHAFDAGDFENPISKDTYAHTARAFGAKDPENIFAQDYAPVACAFDAGNFGNAEGSSTPATRAFDAGNCENSFTDIELANTENQPEFTHNKVGSGWNYHANFDSLTKLYLCDLCTYTSKRKGNFLGHRRIHMNEKPFKCDVCNYRAARVEYLKSHYKKHIEDKPYQCKYCDHRAKRYSDIKSHTNIHTGYRPYPCPLCTYRARQRANLGDHMMMHSGDKPFKCDKCSYATCRKKNLKRHQESHQRRILFGKEEEQQWRM